MGVLNKLSLVLASEVDIKVLHNESVVRDISIYKSPVVDNLTGLLVVRDDIGQKI